MSCIYLRGPAGEKRPGTDTEVFRCAEFKRCTVIGPASPELASCESCNGRLAITDDGFAERYNDSLRILDRKQNETHALRNMLAGGAAFLVAGGPSAKRLPLEKLTQRGIFSMGINNMAGYARTNAFVCADPPLKFHHGIWLDPTVMKFIPIPKVHPKRGYLKEKIGNEFLPLARNGKQLKTVDVPNVWGFDRRVWLMPDDSFFGDDGAPWGNTNAGVKRTGQPKTMMTMLCALRLLYYLGARRIFLVGVDFFMDPNAGEFEGYAFGQKKESEACASNNSQYAIANNWLVKMREAGVFERFGVEIYNCAPKSGLLAFDHVPFDVAIEDALSGFPSEPFDLEGWYEKK